MIFRVFWLNIVKDEVYLWYRYCSNLFRKMRREANFDKTMVKILRKSRREEREKGISAMILPKIYIYIYIKDYTLREKNMRFCILINGMAFMHSLQAKNLTLAGMFRCHIFLQRGAHMSPTKDSPLSCFSIISLAKKYALFTVKIPFLFPTHINWSSCG